MGKNANETYFDWLVENTPQWEEHRIERETNKSSQPLRQQKNIFLLRAEDKLCTKFEELAKKIKAIASNKVEQPKVEKLRQPLPKKWCGNCNMVGHQPQLCPAIPFYQEALL